MTRCPHCQSEVDPNSTEGICAHCGARLEGDDQNTIANVGDATIEFSDLSSDPDSGQDDANATIDLTGQATIELTAEGDQEESFDVKAPTTNLAADGTIDFGAQGDDDAISLSWGDAASKTARIDQTIQVGGTVSGFRSSLPIKSRALHSKIESPEGSATLGKKGDAPDYELLDLLGKGGMGVVYTAKQSSIARTVAVKMLKPGGKEGSGSHGSEDQRDKFISEAVITGELEHPNIVPIYDLGANNEGALFYSMKRVRGTPWDDVIKEKTLVENLGILMRVADAVAFAHASGVIHRDLKPENVMLGGFGEVLVMDWGLARVTEEFPSAESVYQSENLGGTPAYMAPEMTVGPVDKIDARSDVYLLGAILYEIIGGKPPHTGKSAMACLMAASKNKIQPIDYQGELLTTALKAMQTKPEDRFQSVKEFQESVQDYLSHAESVALSESAARNLEQARETGDYEIYSRALFAFEEAIELWDENESAHTGCGETRLAYARTASEKGDLDLSLSLLETPVEDRQAEQTALLEEVRTAQKERKARQRRLRDAKRLALALLLAVIGLGAYSYYEINKQKDEAVSQRKIAEEQRQIAVVQEQIAIEKKEEADAARLEEEKQRNIAEKNERLAKENEKEAIAARMAAEEAKQVAEEARKVAEIAKASEEYEAYVARIGLASEKIEENAFREALALLEACPPEMRHWEWGRLRYLCDLSEQVYDLGAPVDAVAYSPDGKAFASGDWNGQVVLRNVEKGESRWTTKLGSYVHAIAFSPNGSMIAVGTSKGDVMLLESRNGQKLKTLQGHEQGVLSVGFSPDGLTLVSSGYDQTARIWDVATGGKQLQVLQGHSWWVWSAEFSPDAAKIVTAGQDGKAIVWRRDDEGFKPLTEFTGHTGPVYDATFSPDGKLVATCSHDQTVSVWDAEVGLPIDLEARIDGRPDPPRTDQLLRGHTEAVRSVAFAPDGKRLISGGQDNSLRVWDLAESSSVALRGHGGRVRTVAFSPSGRHALSGGHDNQVRVWDIGGYREQRVLRAKRLDDHQDAVLSARFSEDGQQLVTASRDRTARLWDLNQVQTIHTLSEGHAFLASSAKLFDYPQGMRLVTSAGDNTTRVWDVASGVQRFVLEETGRSAAIDVSPDGTWLATGGREGKVRWWNLNSGELITEAQKHPEEVTAIAVGPHGDVLASGDDRGQICLWRRDATGVWNQSALLAGHSRTITGLVFTPDGKRLISSSGDRSCGQWDVDTAQEIRSRVLRHPEWVSAISISQDGAKLLTACDDGVARLWNLSDSSVIAEYESDKAIFNDVDLAPDGNSALLTAAGIRTVYHWNLATNEVKALDAISDRGGIIWSTRYGPRGNTLVTIGGNDAQLWQTRPLRPAMRFSPHGAVADAALSPDGKLIATGSWDTTAKLWDAQTGKPVRKLIGGHKGFVNSLDYSPDGKELLTAGDDGQIRFWNVKGGDLIEQSLTGHRGRVLQARYAPGGRVLTASSDKKGRVWNRASGEVLLELTGHEWAVNSIAISQDGDVLVTGSDDNTAIVWDAKSGEQLQRLAGHTAGVASVAISPDGRRILTGGLDGVAKLWDARTGKELLALSGHTSEVTWVEFSPNGSSALTASRDGAVIVWPTAN